LLAGAALVPLWLALPVHAQTTGAANPTAGTAFAAAERDAEAIIVTGSRIARSGFKAPTPTTVFNADDIAKTSATNIGQIVTAIPAFVGVNTPSGSAFTSNRAGGSFLNLRGLGDNRTLVLVNGRRFVPTTSEATLDTNVIPSGLIERIDVVTGGASAAYGSDAVAGVVNVVLKRELEGFQGDVQSGISARGDNQNYRGSLAWGTKWGGGRGNFLIAAEGERNDGVGLQTTRDWGRGGFGIVGNPGSGPSEIFAPNTQFSLQTTGGLILSGAAAGTDFGPGGMPRPFAKAPGDGFVQIGGSGVRGADYITLSVPYDRYSVYGKVDYDLGGTTIFAEASHSFSVGDLPIIPASNFGSITIQRDNAYLPASVAAIMDRAGQTSFRMGRFFADFGPLNVRLANTTDRVVAGLEGGFGDKWKWTVYGQYGQTISTNDRSNNQNFPRFFKSVDAVRNSAGQIVCRVNAVAGSAGADSACVPVNLFGEGSPSAAAQAYFLGNSRLHQKIEQSVFAANLSGDLFELNGKPVSLAVGAEYRKDTINADVDADSAVNNWAFGNPKALSGSQDVKEAYAEVLVPLLADLPFAKAVDFNGAVRFTDYSGSGTVTTWKLGGTWDIVDGFRLRATRSRDIRAPNLNELYGASNVNFVTLRDPFTNTTVNIPETTQGNAALQPEKANTFTVGVVVAPSFAPGFRASVDYYNIKIGGAVAILASQDLLNRCFAGNQDLCSLTTRNSAGVLTSIVRTQVNVAEVLARGIDFEANYRFALGGGGNALTLRGLASYVDKLKTTNGAVSIDRAGEVGGNNGGLPHWRFTAGLTYEAGPFTAYIEDRFIGGGKYDNTLGPSDINIVDIGSVNYVNMSLQLAVINQERRRFDVFFKVDNLFDKDPPLAPSNAFVSFQTNAQLYDIIGRRFSTGVRFRY
jgi:outer membrane receptor protein involved in Fe transport